MSKNIKLRIIAVAALAVFSFPSAVNAFSQGSVEILNIESSQDLYRRGEISAVLQRVTNEMLFYVEEDWWMGLDNREKSEADGAIYNLSVDFERNIYPKITSVFGSEPDHPVDQSGRVTVLFHRMPAGTGGYFSSGDQYSVFQFPRSNERNILYLNASFIGSPMLEGLLAHEFMHMITFNQKEILRRSKEEIWLNEARAEYIPTFLSYDAREESNLSRRKSNFVGNPYTSLTEWLNRSSDYGVANMFIQYLVDHYGVEILIDSLRLEKSGIESINEALKGRGFEEDFPRIFTDWTIAVLINDCGFGEKYCYLNEQLKDLKIAPITTYLPVSQGSSFAATIPTKNWAGNWRRVVGGKGDLVFEFQGGSGLNFAVPYVLCGRDGLCEIGFLNLIDNKAEMTISGFGEKYDSFYFIPSLQNKSSGFNGQEREYSFTWKATIVTPKEDDDESQTIQMLLARIAELEMILENLRRQNRNAATCVSIDRDLFFGMRSNEVRCLQEFLKSQTGVYPEGLVTGNFLELTRNAVVLFQEKYAAEVLAPLGLSRGTGYVGARTRAKINEILGGGF